MTNQAAVLGKIHWIGGLVSLVPYVIYQWRHYFSVKAHSSHLHYKLGLATFASFCIVVLSGIPLLLSLDTRSITYIVIDLTHVVSSFAFLILLSGHLVLVAKVALMRAHSKESLWPDTFAVIGKRIVVVPLFTCLVVLLLLFVALT